MKKVKNNADSTRTWCGMEISSGAYYELQSSEFARWANNEEFLTALANSAAVMNNGSADITNVAEGINFLKDIPILDTDGTPLFRSKPLSNTDNLLFKGTGVSGTAAKATDANTPVETNIDFKMPETRLINGVMVILKGHVFGDSGKFQVVDVDNILGYGAGVVLNEFATNWYFIEEEQDQHAIMTPYPANLLKDLYVRLKYRATGAENDVKVLLNLFLHKKQ